LRKRPVHELIDGEPRRMLRENADK
jgi:hypothetical protein